MKTSFVIIASVLLAGVALQVAALRFDNNGNQADSNDQWIRSQQGEPYDRSSEGDTYQNNGQRNDNNQQWINNNDQQLSNHNNQQQLNHNNDKYQKNDLDSATTSSGQSGQNQAAAAATGLTGKMIEKIAAFQKIARDNGIADRAQYLAHAAAVKKNVIKMSERDFVNFYDATIKHLDNGRLDYLYLNPERDTLLAQFQFDQIETVGSLKSNVAGAQAGSFAVTMNRVKCNVSTGFNDDEDGGEEKINAAAVLMPARFRFADAVVKTDDGAETRAFDAALERRYLGVLQTEIAARVIESVDQGGVIGQMKRELRKPIPVAEENPGKLFDMNWWTEDGVSMAMADIGFENQPATEPMMRCTAVSFYRESAAAHLYKMRYHFALGKLQWSSTLAVRSAAAATAAGKTIRIRSANFEIPDADVHVTVVNKSYDGQRQQRQLSSCAQVNANVDITGFRFDPNDRENVPPEFASIVQDKLQRFVQHSLENLIQESLTRELCHGNQY